jgi:hypothetical protein
VVRARGALPVTRHRSCTEIGGSTPCPWRYPKTVDCTGEPGENPRRSSSMTVSRRRKLAAYTALAVVTVASLASAPPLVAQTTASSPVRLSGDAVGGVRLGTSQARAIGELATIFGRLKTTNLKALEWCGLTAQSTGHDVLFNFQRGRLVGYELGDAYGKTAGQPNVVTVAGLRLGGTIAQADKIYGQEFITSAAQGGSWKVKTPTGEMVGLLVNPPMTGSTDQVEMIGAGDFGCAAMGP